MTAAPPGSRCGSCGEPAPYLITLHGEPMPACLRHLNHWRTPNMGDAAATWEVVPDSELPKVLAATREGRCVACYGPIAPEHGGLYCCGCDDLCEHSATTKEADL